MADYYPLIRNAVAALDEKSREARSAVYDRARTALANQLQEADPPFLVERERSALEDAINKVEAEWPIPERLQVESNERTSGSNVRQTQAPDDPSKAEIVTKPVEQSTNDLEQSIRSGRGESFSSSDDARTVIAFWMIFVCIAIIIWLIIWLFNWLWR